MTTRDMLRGVAALAVVAITLGVLAVWALGNNTPRPTQPASAPLAASPRPSVTAPPASTATPALSTATAIADILMPVSTPCGMKLLPWVNKREIDPSTWEAPPLPTVCIPDDWPLRTWRPETPIVGGIHDRPWILIDGLRIDQEPDALTMRRIIGLMTSFEARRDAITETATQISAEPIEPWTTGRWLAVNHAYWAEQQAEHEARPFDSVEIRYQMEALVIDIRGGYALAYVWHRGWGNHQRFQDTGDLRRPNNPVMLIGGLMERWEISEALDGRWLLEWAYPVSGSLLDHRVRAIETEPDFATLVPYHDFYYEIMRAEATRNDWLPRIVLE